MDIRFKEVNEIKNSETKNLNTVAQKNYQEDPTDDDYKKLPHLNNRLDNSYIFEQYNEENQETRKLR